MRAPILIVGSGPAGYTAAIYAARAMLKPILVAGFEPGGQLMITSDVENYPGFADPIGGPWLMEQMRAQAAHVGATLVDDHIVKADLSGPPFRLVGDGGRVYEGEALVIATGAKAKWLGIPGEIAFRGRGVSACATCDGFFYRGKRVAVIGGGNTALEEALYLSNLASHVTVVHRRDDFRGERILRERLLAKPNVSVAWNSAVDDILGAEAPGGVTGLRLRDVRDGAVREIAVEGVFVAIGHAPASELFSGQIDIRPDGYVVVAPGTTRTSKAGVFAAGDVADDMFRQAVTAAGLGCMAALEAERWLAARQDVRVAAE
ncbi:MAG: thioredoxin-disulfide reductase [Hyphomicrobiales bacterium]|nr:thioredoxin-disulfide reductase [Hyphomicrobiales bacterium]MDE2016106.1 thioredoxin-disulfide reductase [Hyphomicrobiales bacterium]